jgi:anti-sigma factor RsiW
MYCTNLKDTILIEQYLDGELSDKELVVFNSRLQSDKGFSKEVELHKDINRFLIQYFEAEKFRETLNKIHQSLFPNG